jgi:NADP-dependent 3-hydroxy acid dehydrogenase YdfG
MATLYYHQLILIVRATPVHAEGTTRLYGKQSKKLFLIARNEEWLAAMIKDFKIRGSSEINHGVPDVNDLSRRTDVFDRAVETHSGIATTLIAHGAFLIKKCASKIST